MIYESIIRDFGEHEGRKFANVEFIGYGNQDNVWMETLMPSQGSEAISKQKQEAGVVDKPDSVPAQPDRPPRFQQVWKVGDYCRAKWSQDNVIYESIIRDFGEHEGRKFANVEIIGYGNQDNVWIETLMPSQGSEAIARQKQEARA